MIKVRRISNFDDPTLDRCFWQGLSSRFQADNVFVTWEWQAAWWDAFGRGKLLLLIAERNDEPIVIAPMFADSGMVFFSGSGGSDYLDFVGDISNVDALRKILQAARDLAPDFIGFRFYHIPSWSNIPQALCETAKSLDLSFIDEGKLPAPALLMDVEPEAAQKAASKKSMLRHERWFKREGTLNIEHIEEPNLIAPHLPDFFDQHERRWENTPYPSLFKDNTHRVFYDRILTRVQQTDASWLRFTRVTWNDSPIAYHLGFHLGGRFLWYKPSFEVKLAKRSPGEVLLQSLILKAESENARIFDFGLGDEPFKQRFTNHKAHVGTWGLYPSGN